MNKFVSKFVVLTIIAKSMNTTWTYPKEYILE